MCICSKLLEKVNSPFELYKHIRSTLLFYLARVNYYTVTLWNVVFYRYEIYDTLAMHITVVYLIYTRSCCFTLVSFLLLNIDLVVEYFGA